jgi:hypothetical protein
VLPVALLVAGPPVRDLLGRAKYLFIAATVPYSLVRAGRAARAETSRALCAAARRLIAVRA